MQTEINKYLDLFAYQVETDENGEKQIHIDGYCYWNDESYQLVQGTFCYVSLKELKACEDNEDRIEFVWERFEDVKQYQCEATEQEVVEYYKECKELPIDFVSSDTPDGWYVDYY
jgi:hypothetical protein